MSRKKSVTQELATASGLPPAFRRQSEPHSPQVRKSQVPAACRRNCGAVRCGALRHVIESLCLWCKPRIRRSVGQCCCRRPRLTRHCRQGRRRCRCSETGSGRRRRGQQPWCRACRPSPPDTTRRRTSLRPGSNAVPTWSRVRQGTIPRHRAG